MNAVLDLLTRHAKAPIYFAVLALALVIDFLWLGRSKSAIARLVANSRSTRTDFVVAALHWTGWSTLLLIPFSGGALWALDRLADPLRDAGLITRVPFAWLQVVLVFLLVDFLHYWYHRICHEIAFLWEAHKYHHAATEFTILTGNRLHALEEIFREVVLLVPLALLGTPAPMYMGVRLTILLFDMLQHSMVSWDYGWFGRWVIFSPVGHRIHHSAEREHWDRNYGDILVVWDRLFGTWYDGARVNTEVGVSDNQYNRRGVIREYLDCGVRYLSVLVVSLRTGRWRTDHQRELRELRASRERMESLKSDVAPHVG